MTELRQLVLATRNAHKVAELRRILASAGVVAQLLDLDAVPPTPEVAETAETFAGNALLKARAVASATGLPAVADDSGLCVDALHGMPGVLSARWAGRHGDDPANLALVLAQLVDVPDERRGARFVCAAAAVLPAGPGRPGRELLVEGELAGTIVRAGAGTGGFGYDPIFRPDGDDRTLAALSPEAKDAISHRGKAFRALASQLPDLFDAAGAGPAH
ncbi:MAG: RdgB/HAM1 family non-canonical purine NTP pyrophosphatase [Actinomycetota bacterium]|nr:MAG: RdgB/HAM1 family non-canonical purine NTP pyrophosphatase [Actinomycetota bacterium]